MNGSMQDWPLLTTKLIDHAAAVAPDREIVTNTVEGPRHRTTWREVRSRAKRVAAALDRLGVAQGDRVGTLAWNTFRHVECWYGITGIGAVSHTINPRLFDEQISFIINHAEDRVLLFDLTFLDLVARIAPQLTTVEHFILLTDRAHMPANRPDLLCYEEWIADEDADKDWTALDENAPAGLCYTSGTTGDPKGVLYTHRSNVLHAMAAAQVDVLALSSRAAAMPIVPMFHANAWAMPYAAAMTGAKLVLAGPNSDAPTLHRLIVEEDVTVTAAVPTIWLAMLQHLRATGATLGVLQRIIIGGSAAPRSMIAALQNDHGVEVVHAWGLTETSPIASAGRLCASGLTEAPERRLDLQCKQGRAVFGVEMEVFGDDGAPLPRDGRMAGHLKVRGPWVAARYFKAAGGNVLDADGWFDTGDIGTLDARGYMQITDRSKDVIKSGGEWISSIELENAAVDCPGVAEAAVIGVPDERWGERPLLAIVRDPESKVDVEAVRSHLAARVARWWLPERIVFVSQLPHTATGKILKSALREQFA